MKRIRLLLALAALLAFTACDPITEAFWETILQEQLAGQNRFPPDQADIVKCAFAHIPASCAAVDAYDATHP